MMKRTKKTLMVLLCILGISTVLGITDCWTAGTSYRNTLFSIGVWKMRDGGTCEYIGLGYSITYYRKMGGEHGPEIWYWFAPFTIYHTSERSGIRWLLAGGVKEPTYQNRSLSEWIDIYSRTDLGNSEPNQETARLAIQSIGTNAIPVLLEWLSADKPSISLHSTVLEVFKILGMKGRPAVPALAELTKNKDAEIRGYALDCLFAVNPKDEILVPILIPLIHDSVKSISFDAAVSLANLDHETAKKAGVFNIFPQLDYVLESNKTEIK